MITMLLLRPGLAAAVVILLSILAGALGCGNQSPGGDGPAATLAPMATAIPTATVRPTPTFEAIATNHFVPCQPTGVGYSSYPFFLHWTPDGARLIFNRFPLPQIFSISSDVSGDGSGMRYLVNANPANRTWDDLYADVSPDGARIVYSSCTVPPGLSVWEGSKVTYEISVMDADGSGARDLTATKDQYERFPVWSPGGDRIAYMTTDDIWWPGDLSVMDYQRSSAGSPGDWRGRTIFQSSDDEMLELYPPAWSPDGGRIAFITSEPFDGDLDKPRYFLNVAAADGSVRERIATTISVAAWSPDGGRIALIRREGDATALFTIAPDGSGLRRIARIGEWIEYPWLSWERGRLFDVVAWSPDGGRVLYSCQGLCVAEVDGGGVVERWDFEGGRPNRVRAAWSPDGARVAVYAPGAHFWERSRVYIRAVDGDEVRTVDWVRGD